MVKYFNFFLLALFVLGRGVALAEEKYEIVVLGSRIPVQFDAKRQVYVIGKEELRRLPALNLAQLLGTGSHANVLSRGLFQADVQLDGLNMEQVLLMIDGVPVNNPQTGHHNFNLPLDIAQVERIEILRGGFSSLYGSAGPGGVINLVTSGGKSLHLSAGSFASRRASFNWSGKHVTFSAGRMRTGGFQPGTDGGRWFGRLGFTHNSKKSALQTWGALHADRFGAAGFYSAYPAFEALQRAIVSLQYQYQLRPSLSLWLNGSVQQSRDRFWLYRENPDYYQNDHRSWRWAGEVGMKKVAGHWSYLLGASWLHDSIASTGLRQEKEVEALGHHSRDQYAIFAEGNLVSGRWTFNPGLRWNAGFFQRPSFHGHVACDLSQSLRLRGSLNTSFRLPSFTELYYSDPVHRANPYLQPETGWGVELGASASWHLLCLDVALFANSAGNLIDWCKLAEETEWTARNIRRSDSWGAQASCNLDFDQLRLRLSYAWRHVYFRQEPEVLLMKYHYYLPGHTLSLWAEWQRRAFFVSLAGKFEMENRQVNSLANVRLGWQSRHFTLYGDLLNLFNERVEKIPGLPEAPRSVSLGLDLSW